jgi:hypothetical protein
VALAQPVVEKPSVNRFYGTARPPGAPGGVAPGHPGGGPPVVGGPRPPAAFGGGGPSVYVPPPAPVRPVPPPVYYRPPPPRVGLGVTIGPPWPYPYPYPYGPRYYGWPYYDWPAYPPVVVPPAVVVTPPAPTVYVERPPEPQAPPAAGYWYWCAEPQGWYPDVRECPNGWQQVAPRAAQSQ